MGYTPITTSQKPSRKVKKARTKAIKANSGGFSGAPTTNSQRSERKKLQGQIVLLQGQYDAYIKAIKDLEEEKQIDVYFSLDENLDVDYDFDINDEDVVKLSAVLPKRKMDFEVTPSIIKYTISKSMDGIESIYSRQITIKNTGDVVLYIITYSPPYDTNDDFYPKYKPYYRGHHSNLLKPGETVQCKIESNIGHMGEYNTPINVYQTDLFIGTFFNENSIDLICLEDIGKPYLKTTSFLELKEKLEWIKPQLI